MHQLLGWTDTLLGKRVKSDVPSRPHASDFHVLYAAGIDGGTMQIFQRISTWGIKGSSKLRSRMRPSIQSLAGLPYPEFFERDKFIEEDDRNGLRTVKYKPSIPPTILIQEIWRGSADFTSLSAEFPPNVRPFPTLFRNLSLDTVDVSKLNLTCRSPPLQAGFAYWSQVWPATLSYTDKSGTVQNADIVIKIHQESQFDKVHSWESENDQGTVVAAILSARGFDVD
jgi:hypothetical protein